MRSQPENELIVETGGRKLRLFGLAVGCSAVGLCATFVLFGFFVVAGHDATVPIQGDWRIGLDPDTVNTRLVLFNGSSHHPYRGGIVAMGASASGPTIQGWGDRMGIYYREVQWLSGQSEIVLSFRAVYLLLLFGVLPVIWGCRRVARAGSAGFPVEAASGGKSQDVKP